LHVAEQANKAMQLFKPSNKGAWIIVNSALVLSSLGTGYAETDPRILSQSNPELAFCITILIMTPMFVLWTVYQAKAGSLVWPSWKRSPLRWSGDPLQAIFVSTCCALGLFAGSLFRAYAQHSGFWMAASFGSLFVGFLLGQLIAFSVYRHQIDREIEKTSD
jgi:formate hydrogenlyase subunit 3/multisubunit Na+/H+ antiporter MnhD subunit